LTSTAAVTAIFGVGGGSLAAYKMQRRTQGLTEFKFQKESRKPGTTLGVDEDVDLFSTIAIAGWVRDEYDFQRPWGVSPTHPRLTDRLELLERFYSVYRPDHVPKCRKILQSWEGEETKLWEILRQKYGRDPDHLFPLDEGPRYRGKLTLEQEETVDQLFVELGYVEPETTTPVEPSPQQSSPLERMRLGLSGRGRNHVSNGPPSPTRHSSYGGMHDSLHGPHPVPACTSTPGAVTEVSSFSSSGFESVSTAVAMPADTNNEDAGEKSIPKHLLTVWDYEATYGGELYTVKWESELLIELCDSVADLALDFVTGGTAQILKHTALSTLMSAIAWPVSSRNSSFHACSDTTSFLHSNDGYVGTAPPVCLFFSTRLYMPPI